MLDPWIWRWAYLPFVVLSVLGVYLMLSHRNFIKALVGLQVFQTGIILFFIILAVRADATIPIQPTLKHDQSATQAAGHAAATDGSHPRAADDHPDPGTGHREDHDQAAEHAPHYDAQAAMHNPLPHALMLTAIVVGVATQGVGLAILRRNRNETGTIEDTADGPEEDVS